VISQFSEFQDDSEPDINEEVLQEIDQDERLFMNDHDTNLEDFSEESNLEPKPKPEDKSESESESESGVFFAIPPLTGYSNSLSASEILEKLNLFAKHHEFALVMKNSVLKQKT
jgi:hypothetical protein